MKQILGHALLFTALVAPAAQAQLDERCTVSIFNQTAQVRHDGSWVISDVPATMGPVRARAICTQNGITRFGSSGYLNIPAGGGIDDVSIEFEVVKPIPAKLTLTAPRTALAAAGETVQVTATTTFNDGSTADVTSAASGTVFLSTNPNVASVSASGLVTARASGNVIVSATNEGTLALLRITIASIVDSDGDGMPDDYETANGLKPFDPNDARSDDDYDGLSAVEEYRRGTNPTNFDSDADGLSDGLEIQTGSDPLDPSSFNLGEALVGLFFHPAEVPIAFDTLIGSGSATVQLYGRLSDGYNIDLTSRARGTSYASSNPGVAAASTTDGTIVATSAGAATITATNGIHTATTQVTVTTFAPRTAGVLSFNTDVRSVAVNGNYAYVGSADGRIHVVNIMDRNAPRIDASLAVPSYTGGPLVTIENSSFVYAADVGGFSTINVSIPTNPSLLRRDAIPGSVRDMTAMGSGALIFGTDSGLRYFRFSDNTIYATLPIFGVRSVSSTEGHYAVALDSNATLHIIPRVFPPVVARTVNVGGAGASTVRVWGDFAYVSAANGLRTYDIGVSPARLLTTLNNLAPAGRFDVREGYAFGLLGNAFNGPSIVDIGDVGRSIVLTSLPPGSSEDGVDLITDRRYIYELRRRTLVISQFFGALPGGFYRGRVDILSPPLDSEFAEGSTIPVVVAASDDTGVHAMSLRVNGRLYTTAKSPQRTIEYRIPPDAADVLNVTAGAIGLDGIRAFDDGTVYRVIRDVTPPVVIITNPSPPNVTGGQQITVTADASDDGALTLVEFFVDGGLIGSDTQAPYEVPYWVPDAGGVTLTFTARATDGSGNSTTSEPVTVTILGDMPPVVRIVSPLTGAGYWSGADILVVAEASDDVDVNYTQVWVNGVRDRFAWAQEEPYEMRLMIPAGQTSVTITVEARDNRGNTTMSEPVTLELSPTSMLGSVELPSYPWELAVQRDHAYVANGTSGLQVIDVSDPAAPVIAAALPLPGVAADVLVAGAYAFVAAGEPGFHVVDVTSPASPVLLATVPVGAPARGLSLAGERLVVNTDDGAYVFDVRNPRAPQRRGNISTDRPSSHSVLRGDTLFVISGEPAILNDDCYTCSRLSAWDLDNDRAPQKLGEITVQSAHGEGPTRMVLSGDTIYVAGEWFFSSVDVSNPASMEEVARFDERFWFHCCWRDVDASGNLLFAATNEWPYQGVQILDGTSPLEVSILGQVDFSSLDSWFYSNAVVATPEVVYTVASDSNHNVEVSTDYLAIGRYRTLHENPGFQAPAVALARPVAGATVFERQTLALEALATDDYAVTEVAFFVDGQPVGTATNAPYVLLWDVPAGTGVRVVTARATDVAGNTTTSAPVSVTIVADVTAPTVRITAPPAGATLPVRTFTLRADASDDFSVASVTFTVNGTDVGTDSLAPYEFEYTVPAGMMNLVAGARATDPAGNVTEATPVAVSIVVPQIAGSTTVPGVARRIAVNGNHAYLASSDGIHVIDITDPAAPSLVHSAPLGDAYDLHLTGNLLFVKTSEELRVYDVTNPASPVAVSTTPMGGYTQIDFNGPRFFVSGGSAFSEWDVSDPRAPVMVDVVTQFRGGISVMRMHGRWGMALAFDGWLGASELQAYDTSRPISSFPIQTYYDYNGNRIIKNLFLDIADDDAGFIAIAHTAGLSVTRFTSTFLASRYLPQSSGIRALSLQGDWLLGMRHIDNNGNGDANGVLFDVSSRATAVPRATLVTGLEPRTPVTVAGTPTHFVIAASGSDTVVTTAHYRTYQDTFGAAPQVTVTAGATASRQRLLYVKALADDDVAVRSVTFRVNGEDVATDTVAPFEMHYLVPTDATFPLSVTARAVDFGGNATTSAAVPVPLQ